jgi:hypothetical protein
MPIKASAMGLASLIGSMVNGDVCRWGTLVLKRSDACRMGSGKEASCCELQENSSDTVLRLRVGFRKLTRMLKKAVQLGRRREEAGDVPSWVR